jgi:hypothetical protein
MDHKLFISVCCPECGRISANEFDRDAVSGLFALGKHVVLRCAYRENTWLASPHERAEILKTLNESILVDSKCEIALRPDEAVTRPAPGDHRSALNFN